MPGPADLVEVVARATESNEAVFCMSADISQAHRQVKVRPADWPLLGCRARSDSQVLWFNRVGTFGVSSAAILWSRLFGCVGRWVLRALCTSHHFQVIYVDDLHIIVYGPGKFVVLWMVLSAYLAVGTPFSFRKFKGGVSAEFVGYFLSYEKRAAGISPKRLQWVIEWINEVERGRWFVTGRRFSEFLGRLNFVARLLGWIRPFLAPLFAFNSVLRRSTVARMPELAHISLVYIRDELRATDGLQTVNQVWYAPREVFRTDAKCEPGRVVVAGWSTMQGLDTKQAPWFSLEIKPNDLPFLFKEDGESGWASTSAEFLASYAAMFAFGHLQGTVAGVKDCVQVSVCGGTDNKSTPEVQRKGLTTKWPLFGLQMCAHAEMKKVNKRLVLNWRPRDENSNADALTNSDFSGFSPGLRVPLVLQQLPLGLMHRLTKVRQGFLEARSTLVSLQPREAKCTKREKQATKTAW